MSWWWVGGKRWRGHCLGWQLGFCFGRRGFMALLSITENLKGEEELHLWEAQRSPREASQETFLKGKQSRPLSPVLFCFVFFTNYIYFQMHLWNSFRSPLGHLCPLLPNVIYQFSWIPYLLKIEHWIFWNRKQRSLFLMMVLYTL